MKPEATISHKPFPNIPGYSSIPQRAVFFLQNNTDTIDGHSISTNVPIQISFKSDRPKKPLPPLVQADYTVSSNPDGSITTIINVSAIVFINVEAKKGIEKSGLEVLWNNNLNDLKFLIMYDAEEVNATNFYAYQVDFSIPYKTIDTPIELSEALTTITTYLVNKDPTTSRGTKTTVQPTTGVSPYCH